MGAGPAVAGGTAATDPGAAVAAAPSASAGSTSGSANGAIYEGSVVQTRWGAVQVTITVTDRKITSVAVPRYPTANRRDQEINARALPILKRETLDAQSADIDTVSGATVTSDGYIESLQAALDAAHLS
ncbi:hypothetical protein GCM10009557_03990 [Virgisporangium ochraceum]|uniref:FMN-binding domain-containing protein n=2 Tax=Virgisporangium ochraceum TaxID=65505 RepID=A0A8J3ZX47_9ACTN|nr:hypothetical protein Voc01_066010 [Virgisporangium ochraceum]